MWHDDGSRAKTASNLNNASNICTMYQISKELGEAGTSRRRKPRSLSHRPMLEALLVDLHIHAVEKRPIKAR
jgi:hypothetical protein